MASRAAISVPVAMGIAVIVGDRLPVVLTVVLGVGLGSLVGLLVAESAIDLVNALAHRDHGRSAVGDRRKSGTARLRKDPPILA